MEANPRVPFYYYYLDGDRFDSGTYTVYSATLAALEAASFIFRAARARYPRASARSIQVRVVMPPKHLLTPEQRRAIISSYTLYTSDDFPLSDEEWRDHGDWNAELRGFGVPIATPVRRRGYYVV